MNFGVIQPTHANPTAHHVYKGGCSRQTYFLFRAECDNLLTSKQSREARFLCSNYIGVFLRHPRQTPSNLTRPGHILKSICCLLTHECSNFQCITLGTFKSTCFNVILTRKTWTCRLVQAVILWVIWQMCKNLSSFQATQVIESGFDLNLFSYAHVCGLQDCSFQNVHKLNSSWEFTMIKPLCNLTFQLLVLKHFLQFLGGKPKS